MFQACKSTILIYMCVCIYIISYIIYYIIYVYICIYVYVYMNIYVYIYNTYVYLCIPIYVYLLYIGIHTFVCICIYTYQRIQTSFCSDVVSRDNAAVHSAEQRRYSSRSHRRIRREPLQRSDQHRDTDAERCGRNAPGAIPKVSKRGDPCFVVRQCHRQVMPIYQLVDYVSFQPFFLCIPVIRSYPL